MFPEVAMILINFLEFVKRQVQKYCRRLAQAPTPLLHSRPPGLCEAFLLFFPSVHEAKYVQTRHKGFCEQGHSRIGSFRVVVPKTHGNITESYHENDQDDVENCFYDTTNDSVIALQCVMGNNARNNATRHE